MQQTCVEWSTEHAQTLSPCWLLAALAESVSRAFVSMHTVHGPMAREFASQSRSRVLLIAWVASSHLHAYTIHIQHQGISPPSNSSLLTHPSAADCPQAPVPLVAYMAAVRKAMILLAVLALVASLLLPTLHARVRKAARFASASTVCRCSCTAERTRLHADDAMYMGLLCRSSSDLLATAVCVHSTHKSCSSSNADMMSGSQTHHMTNAAHR
jgi:hypothetical protein